MGDAGIIVTQNNKLADRCRTIANHGQKGKDHHLFSGKNSRMDTLQAAILSAKIKHLSYLNSERRKNAEQYYSQLSSDIKVPLKNTNHVYHQFVIQVERREELIKYLDEKGIGTAIHYPYAVNTYKFFYKDQPIKACPVAEGLIKNILSLPIYPGINPEQINYVTQEINNFYP